MTTKRILIALLITSVLWGISCSSNNDNPVVPKPDGPALISLFDDNVDSVTQSFTISSEAASEIKGTEGTTIKFPANILKKANGDAVTGNVKIQLIEIYKRSHMLITKKVTGGKDADGNIAMLISGGEFYVNATQDGNQLKLSGTYNILAPTGNTGDGISQDMIQFNGVAECDGDDCKVIWEVAKDRGIKVGELQNTGGSYTVYSAFCGNFGWTNIDRWYSDPRTKTTIFVDVPEGYDNTNCAVFLSYDGEPTALARFDKYDAEKGMFTEHYGLIPIGLDVHFIFVSIVDDELKYAIQGAKITENHVEAIGELKTLTEAELVALVDDLP